MNKKNIKILLVDDEEKFLTSISERIRLKGFEPLSASSGEEALEIASNITDYYPGEALAKGKKVVNVGSVKVIELLKKLPVTLQLGCKYCIVNNGS